MIGIYVGLLCIDSHIRMIDKSTSRTDTTDSGNNHFGRHPNAGEAEYKKIEANKSSHKWLNLSTTKKKNEEKK